MFLQAEIDKFNDLAHEWWNLDGSFKTLHQINPARVEFVRSYTPLEQQKLIDVGCGGGILAESLATQGALVTGIDLAPQSIETAKLHLYESGVAVNYELIEVGKKATEQPNEYDILTCMEMLEHVPDPNYIIQQCAKLLKPGGMAFFSTLNRTLKSYTLGVFAAEYIFKLLPKGTHDYQKFITPAELRAMLKQHGFEICGLKGIDYNPFSHNFGLSNNTSINYLMAARKE